MMLALASTIINKPQHWNKQENRQQSIKNTYGLKQYTLTFKSLGSVKFICKEINTFIQQGHIKLI